MTYPQKELQIMDLRHSYDRTPVRTGARHEHSTQIQHSRQNPHSTRSQHSSQAPHNTRSQYSPQNPHSTRSQHSPQNPHSTRSQHSPQNPHSIRTRSQHSPQAPHSTRSQYSPQNQRRARTQAQKQRLQQERRRRALTKLLTLCFLLVTALCILEVQTNIPLFPGRADAGTLESLSSPLSSQMSTPGQAKSPEELTEKLAELLEKNEETKTFVENYPNRADYIGQPIDLTAELTPGEVPLLMQWDLRWGYENFGESNIGLSGCGPTCLSMAYLYFTRDMTGDPRTMAQFCEENGYYTSAGTSWSLWTSGLDQLGLSGRELSLSENSMKAALDTGSLIVCSMRPGDFTTTGHYILIYGYDENGFYVNDPNRHSTSSQQWDYNTLYVQIKNLWEISGS